MDSETSCKRQRSQTTEDMRKDSFSDRFCDDLCEDILSYLSFEDKIRSECVSKQFRRTIYRKQYSICVTRFWDLPGEPLKSRHWSSLDTESDKINELKLFRKSDGEYASLRDITSFELILRKCPNLKRISILIRGMTSSIANQIIDVVIDYCHLIEEMVFCFALLSFSYKQKFIDKFGHNLKRFRDYISTDSGYFFVNDLDSVMRCPRMSYLDIGGNPRNFHINGINLRELRELSLSSDSSDEVIEFFVNNNQKALKTIDLILLSNTKLEKFNSIFGSLIRLSNLTRLFLEMNYNNWGLFPNSHNNPVIDLLIDLLSDRLKIISLNCCSIKSLELIIARIEPIVCHKMFESIKYFTQLKRLKLSFNQKSDDNQIYSSESLKLCPNITHLELNFSEHIFDDKFFREIHKSLPKLRYLSISSVNLTQVMINSISKLKDIQTLIISIVNEWNYQFLSYIKDLIENLPKIKSIQIFNQNNSKLFDLDLFWKLYKL